jgi:hypothetical protein
VLVTATVCPVTTPVVATTVATDVLLLLHVPPPGVSPSGVVYPEHTVFVPVIAVGNGFTVNTALSKQPVGKIYVIVSRPAVTPVATPVPDIIVALPLLAIHVPPAVASVRGVVSPTHTWRLPFITPGSGFTVTVAVTIQPVPSV